MIVISDICSWKIIQKANDDMAGTVRCSQNDVVHTGKRDTEILISFFQLIKSGHGHST